MERQKDGLAYQKAVVAKYGLEEDPFFKGRINSKILGREAVVG